MMKFWCYSDVYTEISNNTSNFGILFEMNGLSRFNSPNFGIGLTHDSILSKIIQPNLDWSENKYSIPKRLIIQLSSRTTYVILYNLILF